MTDFLLPSLGADMDEAQLVAWRVAPGDPVRRGQVIAEIETDKGIIEVECWQDGVIEQILVEPGPAKLRVGTPLARIRTAAGEPEVAAEAPAAPVPPAIAAPPAAPTPAATMAPAPGEGAPRVAGPRAKSSPLARARAQQLGIDLAGVTPSGPDGIVTAEDVERAAERAAVGARDEAAAMRQAIARSMARSKREIPHYYLASRIDLHAALQWLDRYNENRAVAERLLSAALLLKATALALRSHPDLNGHWVGEAFQAHDTIHIGVAVSLREGGLVAPAIHDADRLDLSALMAKLRDVVNRARSGRLRSSEVSDPTVTVTNLGDRGVETVFPVIIPPQVAIVGFGRIADAPVAKDGAVAVRPVVQATLAADHRVTDGHRGARFLAELDRLLQEPEKL